MSIDDGIRFISISLRETNQRIAINMMRRVHRRHNVLKWIVVIAPRTNAPIAQILLDLHIIETILFAKLTELLSYDILNIFVR